MVDKRFLLLYTLFKRDAKMNKPYGIIYKITNKLNGKIYIGQTVVPMLKRWKQHCSGKCQNYLHYAIASYGAENFTIEQIAEADTTDGLNALETHYIKLLDCIAPRGYNLKAGGDNHKHHPDTRAKMSQSAKLRMLNGGAEQFRSIMNKAHEMSKGRIPWNKGKQASETTKEKLAEAHLGQQAWNKGKVTPIDVRAKQAKAKEKLSKAVYCVDKNITWPSIEQAAKEMGVAPITIKRWIAKGSLSGLTFRFAESYKKVA